MAGIASIILVQRKTVGDGPSCEVGLVGGACVVVVSHASKRYRIYT